MDLLFQKSLTDVIKSLRAAPSPAEEAKILAKTLRDVRREVKSSDPRSKAAALEKLLYLYMLGQAGGSDIAWAAFPSVEAMGCHRSFAVKYVGYLAAAHSLSAAPDVAVLATHQLRKDLTGQHPHDASLALSCIASAAPPGLAAELTTEVVALLNGTRVAGRRKATLAMLRIVHQQQQQQQSSASGGVGGSGGAGDDDELPALLARLAERLHDSDRAVVTAVVSLVCELVLHEQHQRLAGSTPIDPTLQSTPSQAQQTQQQQQRAGSGKPLASKYLPLAPDLFPLLHPSSSPWLLIKLVKTFAALAAAEPRVARKVAEPLAALLRATPSKSLLLECVRAVALSMRHVDSLRQLAIRVAATRLVANEPLSADPGAGGSAGDGCGGAGGGAAGSSTSAAPAAVVGAHDANVRLLGLRALEMFLPHHALEVLRYKAAIIASLDDADPAVQSAALRLITVLVTRPSLVPSVAALRQRMAGAAAARSPLCGELVTAVLQMCGAGGFERVTDFVWYVDVLQDICYVAIVGGGTSSASLALPSHAGAGAAAAASAAAADESVWSLAPLGNPSDSSHGYGRRVSGGLGLTHALSAGAAVADAWAGSERGREVGRHLVAVALGLPVPVADRPRVRAAALHLALRLVGDTALLRSRAGGDHVLAAAAFLLGECAHELLPRGSSAAAAAADAGAREGSSSTGSGTTALSAPSQSPSPPPQSSRSESAGALDSSLSSLLASLLQPSVLLLPPATQAVFLQAALKVLLALTARATPARLLPGGSPAAAAGSSLGAGGESPDVAVSGGCEAAGREVRSAVAAAAVAEAAGARGSGVQWVVGVLEEARERLLPFLQSPDADVADRACNVAALLGLLLPLLLEALRAEKQVEQKGEEGGGAAGGSEVAGSTVRGKVVDGGDTGADVNGQQRQQQLEQQLLMLHTLASLFPAAQPDQFDAPAPHPPLAVTPLASKIAAVGAAAGKQQLLRAVERAAVAMGVGPPAAMPHGSSSGDASGALAWLDAFGQSSHDEWDSGILFVRALPPRFLPTSSVPTSSPAIPGSRTAAVAAGGAGVAMHGALGYPVPGQSMGGGGGGVAGGASAAQHVGVGAEGSTEEWRKRNSLFYLSSGGSPRAEGRGKDVQSREGEGRVSAGGAEFPAAAAAASSGSARGDFPSAVGDYDYPPAVGDEAVAEFLPSRGSGGGSKRAPPLCGLLEEES